MEMFPANAGKFLSKQLKTETIFLSKKKIKEIWTKIRKHLRKVFENVSFKYCETYENLRGNFESFLKKKFVE